MPATSDPAPPATTLSPARRKFIQRISSLPIKPAARDYYVRWAESWTKAIGHQSAERTQAHFRKSTSPILSWVPGMFTCGSL